MFVLFGVAVEIFFINNWIISLVYNQIGYSNSLYRILYAIATKFNKLINKSDQFKCIGEVEMFNLWKFLILIFSNIFWLLSKPFNKESIFDIKVGEIIKQT